jgi:hypothetical protein
VSWAHDLKWHLMTKHWPKIAAVSSQAFAWIQQSTERWMAFYYWFGWDVRFWMVCLYQLMLALPLLLSMLLLLIDECPNMKWREPNIE